MKRKTIVQTLADGLDRVGKAGIHAFYLWAQLVGKPTIRYLGYCPDCCMKLEALPEVEAYNGYFKPGVACLKCDWREFKVRGFLAKTTRGGA